MSKKLDLIGAKFGRLLVIANSESRTKAGKQIVMCRCECGVEKEVIAGALKSGNSRSCGCAIGESARKRFTVHGNRYHPMYNRYMGMMQRCYYEKSHEYKNYGARGIAVCERWRNSFDAFVEDMGLPPSDELTIDRINNNEGYSKENCRWATKKEQSINRRVTKFIEADGRILCYSDWSRLLGLTKIGVNKRMASGWTEEMAVSAPKFSRKKTLMKSELN